ncbi:MAG TPA: FtsQ-type POTRA domain-containing protein [Candidatus Limnocylindria bacterium]|nr:FtsQ-type POTRA domain-containing protein [Candidatus Limnocylindria bacterium]
MSVTGTRHLTQDAAIAATGLAGRPILTASAADARRGLVALAAVRDARVILALPDAARIEITEREAVGRWLLGGVEWYVDAEGVLFGSVDPGAAPAVRVSDDRETTKSCAGRGGGRCIDPALVDAAFRLARLAPGELRADATRPDVRLDLVNGLVLRSGGSWEVRFGGPERFNEKLSLARKFLSDNPTRRLDYVDVRSPDRIVFSPQ